MSASSQIIRKKVSVGTSPFSDDITFKNLTGFDGHGKTS